MFGASSIIFFFIFGLGATYSILGLADTGLFGLKKNEIDFYFHSLNDCSAF
jgi:hypothetical protein